jgi:hypothetical protein
MSMRGLSHAQMGSLGRIIETMQGKNRDQANPQPEVIDIVASPDDFLTFSLVVTYGSQ